MRNCAILLFIHCVMQYIVDIYVFSSYDGVGGDLLKNMQLKVARIQNDLSQEQLAQRVGVTRQTIGLIEAGKFNPSIHLCISICKALNRTLNDIFWEEKDDETNHG